MLTTHCKNDTLLKGAFEDAFPYLLRFFFEPQTAIFDLRKQIHFMDKELKEIFPDLGMRGGQRFADMLARVPLLNGDTHCIFVHVEIQGKYSVNFNQRMFEYFNRIYHRYGNCVTAIAIFTDIRKPKDAGLFQTSLLGTSISYQYNAFHIFDETQEALLQRNNPFALVILAAQKAAMAGKTDMQELANSRIAIAKALIASKNTAGKKYCIFWIFCGRSSIYPMKQ